MLASPAGGAVVGNLLLFHLDSMGLQFLLADNLVGLKLPLAPDSMALLQLGHIKDALSAAGKNLVVALELMRRWKWSGVKVGEDRLSLDRRYSVESFDEFRDFPLVDVVLILGDRKRRWSSGLRRTIAWRFVRSLLLEGRLGSHRQCAANQI